MTFTSLKNNEELPTWLLDQPHLLQQGCHRLTRLVIQQISSSWLKDWQPWWVVWLKIESFVDLMTRSDLELTHEICITPFYGLTLGAEDESDRSVVICPRRLSVEAQGKNAAITQQPSPNLVLVVIPRSVPYQKSSATGVNQRLDGVSCSWSCLQPCWRLMKMQQRVTIKVRYGKGIITCGNCFTDRGVETREISFSISVFGQNSISRANT